MKITSFLLVVLCGAHAVGRSSAACIALGERCSESSECCDDLGFNKGTSCYDSQCEAECIDVTDLAVPYPMPGDMTITPKDHIYCDTVTDLHVQGGTLTIKSSEITIQRVRFVVYDGASIVFDVDTTTFGPSPRTQDDHPGYSLWVLEGGSMSFSGDLVANEVRDVRSFIGNWGDLDFAGTTTFTSNGNVLRSNFGGNVRFGGKASFINNFYLAIDNDDNLDGVGGTIVFEDEAYFEDNAGSFDGVSGGGVDNCDVCTMTFKKKATFKNHNVDEGAGAVFNQGSMLFKKAVFIDNNGNGGVGGGVGNAGDLTFKGRSVFKRNTMENDGGGLYNTGTVTFEGEPIFRKNFAEGNGGAIANVQGGTILFNGVDPFFYNNKVSEGNCANIFNEDSTIVGVDGDLCNLQ